ncbi:calcium and integrin-binding family member 3 [Ixodes scapularis]
MQPINDQFESKSVPASAQNVPVLETAAENACPSFPYRSAETAERVSAVRASFRGPPDSSDGVTPFHILAPTSSGLPTNLHIGPDRESRRGIVPRPRVNEAVPLCPPSDVNGSFRRRHVSDRMGNKIATFTDEQLEDYQDCTYFTRKEILRVQKRFRELDSQRVPEVMTGNEAHTIDVPMEKIEKMSELKENPFRQRICKVFSHDGSGNMTFDDFLDMLSVFSEPSPRDVKVFYAFRIYDYDEDQMLGPSDIEKATVALTRNQLTPEEVQIVVEKVLEEADMDDDGKLSFTEFEHVITRAPDFIR